MNWFCFPFFVEILKMKNIKLLLFASAILFSLFSYGQELLPKDAKPDLKKYQESFDNWKESTNLEKQKGWKWIARWHEEEMKNSNLNKGYSDKSKYYDDLIKVASNKTQNTNRASANWSPAGPVERPENAGAYGNHGMGRVNCIEFHPTDSSIFWVGVAQGGIWKTTNHGKSYFPINSNLPILRISDIEVNPTNTDEIYLAIGDYAYIAVALDIDERKRHTHYGLGVYKTTDGGVNWNATGLGFSQTNRDASLLCRVFVNPNNENEIIAAGVEGIFKSTDKGTNWVNVVDSLIWDMELDPQNPSIVYATGGWISNLNIGSACILKSIDFGGTWQLLNTGIPNKGEVQRIELAVASQDSNYIYAITCGEDKGFYSFMRSTDGGQSWVTKFDKSDSTNLLAWSDGIDEIGGQGMYDLSIVIDPIDKEKVRIGGVNIWGTDDGGESFDGVSYWVNYFGASAHADQHQFKYNPLDNKYYVCNDGGVYRTDSMVIGDWSIADWGYYWPTKWNDISSGMQITSFYRLGLKQNNINTIIGGAQDNSTFYQNDSSWLNIIGGDGMESSLNQLNDNILYGSSQYGRIYKSFDKGQSYDYYFTQNIWQNEEGAWTTPFVVDPADPNIITAGYENVWRSNDAGNTWSSISNFQSVTNLNRALVSSAIDVSSIDPDVIYVAKRLHHSVGAPSEVWYTDDAGSTWNNITTGLPDSLYFTYLEIDDDNPAKVWVTCGGFSNGNKVYYSDDYGTTWNNLSGNLPNLPANCVVHDNQSEFNTVYAGLDIGVYYYSDTSTQWAIYDENLPNVIISELEINYTERKVFAATFGRGFWMGNLLDEKFQQPVGVDLITDEPFKIYPSPNKGSFTIDLPQYNLWNKIEIVDITGRLVVSELISNQAKLTYNLNLQSGEYFTRLHSGKKIKVVKFIVE
jgi:photosystem II stability/assembly factor-like uncharacterized protein